MTKEEYIYAVTSGIKNKRMKNEVAEELSEHIDDRIQYYTDAGYDYDYALSRTIERTGGVEKPEHDFRMIYKPYGKTGSFSSILVLLLIEALYFSIAFEDSGIYNIVDVDARLFIYFSIAVLYSLKAKSRNTLIVLTGVFAVLKTVLYVYTERFVSGTVIRLIYFLSGKPYKIANLACFTDVRYSPVLKFLSVTMYIVTAAIIIYIAVLLNKYGKKQISVKNIKTVNKLIAVFTVITITVASMNIISVIYKSKNDYYPSSYMDVEIIESDIKYDFRNDEDYIYENVSIDTDNNLSNGYVNSVILNYDNKSSHSGKPDSIKDLWKSFDSLISYKIRYSEKTVDNKPSHKYIYIYEPQDVIEDKYDESKWLETKDLKSVNIKVENGKYPLNYVTLKFKQ